MFQGTASKIVCVNVVNALNCKEKEIAYTYDVVVVFVPPSFGNTTYRILSKLVKYLILEVDQSAKACVVKDVCRNGRLLQVSLI